jgi:hypothetical protein
MEAGGRPSVAPGKQAVEKRPADAAKDGCDDEASA